MTEEEKVAEDAVFFGTGFIIGGKHYPAENVMIQIDYQETEYDTFTVSDEAWKMKTRFEVHGNVYAKGKRQYKRSFRRLWQVTHGFSNSRKAYGWRRHVRRMKAKL